MGNVVGELVELTGAERLLIYGSYSLSIWSINPERLSVRGVVHDFDPLNKQSVWCVARSSPE